MQLRLCTLGVLATISTLGASAFAQTVTLFGQTWQVQRFDYHQQITWPNPLNPNDTLGLLRVEGAWNLGGGHMLVGTSHQDQSPNPAPANFVLEISTQTDAQGSVTGFSYVRTVVQNDPVQLGSSYQVRPNGLATNSSSFGIGAGGGVVLIDAFGDFIRWFDSSTGLLVPFGPTGEGIYVGMYAFDAQDLTLVEDANPALSRLYLLDEPSHTMYAHALDGTQVASFPVAGPADPAAGVGDPKGLAFLSDVVTWPTPFHGQGGTLLISLGDAQPGLQALRTDGSVLGYEAINNTVFHTSSATIKPKIESIAADPVTGRLFLFMEKGSLIDNWVWVLTPDCNGNNLADALEIQSGGASDWDHDGIPDACEGAVGTRFCFGDGSGTPCPCANSGPAGSGCANSTSAAASLSAIGVASVANDTIVLGSQGAPSTSTVVFFQGTQQDAAGAGIALFDGLRCVSGSAIRLAVRSSSSGAASYPHTGETAISVLGLIPPTGGTRHYQVLYRDPAPFCTSATANYTNGLSLTWVP